MELELLAEGIRLIVERALVSTLNDPDHVCVFQVEEYPIFVGCDSNRNLLALVPSSAIPMSLVSGNLQYASSEVLIWVDKPSDVNEVAVLRYLQNSASDIEYFAEATASLCKCLDSGMSGDEICRVVESWFGLLIVGKQPTYSEILGLWGELFVIRSAINPQMALTSWQWKDNEPLDFVYRGCALEVKCTTLPTREHTTSLSQHSIAVTMKTVAVSLVTTDVIDGESVSDIYGEILDLVSRDALLTAKIVSAVARRTRFSPLMRDLKFSRVEAEQSKLYFDWSDLPHPILNNRLTNANWTFTPNIEMGISRESLENLNIELSSVF